MTSSSTSTLVLTVDPDQSQRHTFPMLGGHIIRIGRDPALDVVLLSPEVSREHLRIEISDSTVTIRDCSSNGTYYDEQRYLAEQVPFRPPQTLHLGPFAVHVTLEQPQVKGPPPGTTEPAKDGSAKEQATPPSTSPTPIGHAEEHVPPIDPAYVRLRKEIHRKLLDHLDLAKLDKKRMDDAAMRPRVAEALRNILGTLTIAARLPASVSTDKLIEELCDEALGLGPLESLLSDEKVTEIMVVDPYTIFVERNGRVMPTETRFTDDETVRAIIERIVTPLGRRIDESTPLVDARLKDGSRVNAIIRPLAIRGACITIRKFARNPLTIDDLIGFGTMTERMAIFLQRSVVAKKNIVISGGTGSGKTTLLNVLSGAIPSHERIVTIEDAAELRLGQPHVVSLETRPANMEGRGAYTIRDLVRNALRMRPDRIVVGECRGGEALDMLQAMNTGHEGSMTTTHANTPVEALTRLETLALMAGLDLPSRAIREQIASSVDVVVQQARLSDGSRRIIHITEVRGMEDGRIETAEIFRFRRTGTGPQGQVEGEYEATGYLPSYLDDFIAKGLVANGDYL